MKQLLLICLVLLFFTSCYNPTSQQSMTDLNAIKGEWESYKGIQFNENWRYENENTLEGEGYSMNGNDTSFFESLVIFKERDSIYYSVIFKKESSVNFLLTDASRTEWTFTNPENDYPSIIKYELENDTLLFVTTANIRGNKEQFFYLKRKSSN